MKHCVGGDVCYQDEDMYKKENRQKISAPALLENLTDDANAKLYVAKLLTIFLLMWRNISSHRALQYRRIRQTFSNSVTQLEDWQSCTLLKNIIQLIIENINSFCLQTDKLPNIY